MDDADLDIDLVWDDDELGYEGDYSDYDTLDDEDFL